METRTCVLFIPNIVMLPIHLHPTYVHHPRHHLLLQKHQENDTQNQSIRLPGKSMWTFPGSNILKLNTDGSSKGNPGPSSFGGLIRDGKGQWLFGYMGKIKGKSCTSLEAEIWAIFKGLCLIKDKSLSNLLIETDCEAALVLGVGQVAHDHPLRLLIDVINMIMMEQKCTMIHTRRDGNHCADLLAKLGGKQSEEYTVLEEPPAVLIPYLLRDTEVALELERNRV